jgi:hypothetical protein
MEFSLPVNWFIMQMKNRNLYVNFQDKLISIEPPFNFKNLPMFISNFNLTNENEELFNNLKTKYDFLVKEMKIKERIIKKRDIIKNLDKEEEDLVDNQQLENQLKELIKSKMKLLT